jgi:hypothetical protein
VELEPIQIDAMGVSVKKIVKYFDFISVGIFIFAFIIAIHIYELQDENEELKAIIGTQNALLETQRKYIKEVQYIFDQLPANAAPNQFYYYDNNSPVHNAPL